MRKTLFTLLFLCVGVQFLVAQPKREVRAVWLATNYGLDWPQAKYSGSAAQDLMIEMLDKLQAAHFNTVIFQVQCLGDVLWESEIQPWSKVVTGKYGVAPDYNICDFVVEECHKRGLEVHAGIVPYRIGSKANADGYESSNSNHRHVINTNPEWCVLAGDNSYYLDPALPEVREYLLDLYEELVTTTNFDGINLDYCRYPESSFPDDESFAKYNPDGLAKDDWRRNNINQFVYELYDMIKGHKPTMKLGAAPIGTYKNVGNRGNLEAYGDVFQDACDWMQKEKHDLLIPQMYWTESAGFSENMDVWIQNANSRQLVIGLAAYKMADSNKWKYTVITDQIEKARQKGTQGVSFFRTEHIVGTGAANGEIEKLYAALKDDYFKYPAHIPTMEYNGVTTPNAPKNLTVDKKEGNVYSISWDSPELDNLGTEIRYYSVYAQEGKTVDISDPKNNVGYAVFGNTFEFEVPTDKEYTIAVTAFDTGYYESAPAVVGGDASVGFCELLSADVSVVGNTLQISSGTGIKYVAVYNMLGQLCCSSKFDDVTNCSVSLDNIASGMYVVTVVSEKGSVQQVKFML